MMFAAQSSYIQYFFHFISAIHLTYAQICGKPAITPSALSDARILGGEEAIPGSWPWQVRIGERTRGGVSFFCGGAIVNPYFIITAGHCFPGSTLQAKNYVVRVAEHNMTSIESFERDYNIFSIIKHPRLSLTTAPVNDVTLLRMSYPITFTDRISSICLPESGSDPEPGTYCVTTGWGRFIDQFHHSDTTRAPETTTAATTQPPEIGTNTEEAPEDHVSSPSPVEASTSGNSSPIELATTWTVPESSTTGSVDILAGITMFSTEGMITTLVVDGNDSTGVTISEIAVTMPSSSVSPSAPSVEAETATLLFSAAPPTEVPETTAVPSSTPKKTTAISSTTAQESSSTAEPKTTALASSTRDSSTAQPEKTTVISSTKAQASSSSKIHLTSAVDTTTAVPTTRSTSIPHTAEKSTTGNSKVPSAETKAPVTTIQTKATSALLATISSTKALPTLSHANPMVQSTSWETKAPVMTVQTKTTSAPPAVSSTTLLLTTARANLSSLSIAAETKAAVTTTQTKATSVSVTTISSTKVLLTTARANTIVQSTSAETKAAMTSIHTKATPAAGTTKRTSAVPLQISSAHPPAVAAKDFSSSARPTVSPVKSSASTPHLPVTSTKHLVSSTVKKPIAPSPVGAAKPKPVNNAGRGTVVPLVNGGAHTAAKHSTTTKKRTATTPKHAATTPKHATTVSVHKATKYTTKVPTVKAHTTVKVKAPAPLHPEMKSENVDMVAKSTESTTHSSTTHSSSKKTTRKGIPKPPPHAGPTITDDHSGPIYPILNHKTSAKRHFLTRTSTDLGHDGLGRAADDVVTSAVDFTASSSDAPETSADGSTPEIVTTEDITTQHSTKRSTTRRKTTTKKPAKPSKPVITSDHNGPVYGIIPNPSAGGRHKPVRHNREARFYGSPQAVYGGIAIHSDVLKQAVLPIYDRKNCTSYWKSYVRETMLCTFANEQDAEPCKGDSGGPLVCRTGTGDDAVWTLDGIISFGAGCGGKKPAVYTRVASFTKWVQSVVDFYTHVYKMAVVARSPAEHETEKMY